jgi:N-acetylneuraminic acid mutarotase
MIVWGGEGYSGFPATGARYDPSTDSWVQTSMTNVPVGRVMHTAVWTGNEMILWGGWTSETGDEYLSTGAKYDPMTDSWSATSNVDVPEARFSHTAVWTGTEMIIWGGLGSGGPGEISGALASGGRYDPSTDSWAATSIINAPEGRPNHTAIWTGSEMIIWGGVDFRNYNSLSSGGRYDPSTNAWMQTSTVNAPQGRLFHTAVWTGNEMIIWGGHVWIGGGSLSDGARYDPLTDNWTPTTNIDVPGARFHHSAIWTGVEMIIWGGAGFESNGARYNPSTDSWAPTSIINAPEGRYLHSAIWTGTEMIVWGGFGSINGYVSTGGRYEPSTDSWVPTNAVYVPSSRELHTAIWTGTEMIIWGGRGFALYSTGGRYNPATDDWRPTSTINVPDTLYYHTAVWTGLEMIVWGAADVSSASSGGRYNPSTDSWTPTSIVNVPEGNYLHTAVWTGTEMIVWGGRTYYELSSGGRYNPSTDSWLQTSMTNAPDGRIMHTAVWTGTEMIIWGGSNYYFENFLASGGRYNPATDTWTDTYLDFFDTPEPRADHTAVWTGTEMIVWGGFNYVDETLNIPFQAGSYNPSTDRWTQFGFAWGRYRHTAVWTGSEMIVWGGRDNNFDSLSSGYRFNQPSVLGYIPTSLLDAPEARGDHTAVWTGNEMIVWGGSGRFGASALQTGGLYCVGPNLKISNASIEEGKKGGKTLAFVLTLSTALDFAVKVDYETVDGSATDEGNDYVAKSGTKRIRRGETSTTIKIKVKGDRIVENDEYFYVRLSNAVGAKILNPEGFGRIWNDD